MSSARVLRQKNNLIPNDGFHVIRHFKAALLFDVTPDLEEIVGRFRRKNVAHAHSGLAFSCFR